MYAKSNKSLRAVVIAVLCLAVGAATSSLTRAEDASSSEAVASALVRQVISRQSYNIMLEQMLVGMEDVNPQLKAATANGGHDALLAAMDETLPYEELVTATAKVYARHFTPAELREMRAFYETPTGQKVVSLMPSLTGEAMRDLSPQISERLPAAIQKHMPAHRSR